MTGKTDSGLEELWPAQGDLAASALQENDTVEVCVRHIEAGGQDLRVWKRLRKLLQRGERYQFEAWHYYFFDETRVSKEVQPLASEVVKLVRPLLPAPQSFT